MRFYFHISNDGIIANDREGMELPSFVAALEEGGQLARELMDDPDTANLGRGVINIVASDGKVVIRLPITRPMTRLN